MRFVGRNKELRKLGRCLSSNRSEFVIISGRRRTGKTTLIKEFLRRNRKDVKFVFHEGGMKGEKATLESVFSSFERVRLNLRGVEKSFDGLERLVKKFVKVAEKEAKIPVLVFDEFPRTAQAVPGLQEKLQYIWDGFLKDRKVLVIFSGSSIGMLERIFKKAELLFLAGKPMKLS